MLVSFSTVLLLSLSIIIGSLTLFLVIINWKLWQVSIGIYNVSAELLEETIIIRKALTLDVGELRPKSKGEIK